MFMRRAVESAGHIAAEAENGAVALHVAKEFLPDVALLDWNMPEVDGITCLQLLKARYGTAVKAILTTAEADSARMEEALANGADGYLMKPFTAAALVAAIAQLYSTN